MTVRLAFLTTTLLALGLMAVSCQTRPRGGTPCYDASECSAEDGELATCVEGYCKDVECLSSSDCPLDTICDVEGNDYECKDGCNTDADCRAGKTCEDGQCEEYGCRSTVLDCDRGEFCNEETGECEEAEGAYCTECELAGNEWDLGETTSCWATTSAAARAATASTSSRSAPHLLRALRRTGGLPRRLHLPGRAVGAAAGLQPGLHRHRHGLHQRLRSVARSSDQSVVGASQQ